MSTRHRVKYSDSSHTLSTTLDGAKGVPTAATCVLKDKNGTVLPLGSGTIDDANNASGGVVRFDYTGHAAQVGDVITIAGTTSYNGAQTVTAIATGTFDAVVTYVAAESGTYETTTGAATLMTATTLSAAASAGEDTITLTAVTSVVEGSTLRIAGSADGKHEDVVAQAVGAADVILSEYLKYDHTTATAVSGRFLSYAFDASQSDFTSGLDFSVIWEITNTDDPAWREDAEILKREIAFGGLETKFAALYPHYHVAMPAGEFTTYQDAAFEDLRVLFKWRAGRDIDKMVNPDELEPVLLRQIAYSIALAGDDAWIEERKAMKMERDDWLTRMSQASIWIDTDQDDVEDDSEVQAMDRPLPRRRLF